MSESGRKRSLSGRTEEGRESKEQEKGREREIKTDRKRGLSRERERVCMCLRKMKNLWTHQWPMPAEQFLNGWPLNFHRGIVLTGWM